MAAVRMNFDLGDVYDSLGSTSLHIAQGDCLHMKSDELLIKCCLAGTCRNPNYLLFIISQ